MLMQFGGLGNDFKSIENAYHTKNTRQVVAVFKQQAHSQAMSLRQHQNLPHSLEQP
jgi:hypothetical protein